MRRLVTWQLTKQDLRMHPEGPSGPSTLFKRTVNDQRDPPEASYYLCLTLSECERLWAVWTVEELKSGPLGVIQCVLTVSESCSSHTKNALPLLSMTYSVVTLHFHSNDFHSHACECRRAETHAHAKLLRISLSSKFMTGELRPVNLYHVKPFDQ